MDWNILEKYLYGACSKEELRKLSEWLSESPANEDFFSSFIESFHNEDHISIEADAREAWERFKEKKISSSNKKEISSQNKTSSLKKRVGVSRSRKKRFWGLSVAATLALVFSILFVAEYYTDAPKGVEDEAIGKKEITTTKGQRTNFKLKDGTKVILNSDSKLSIPENYGAESRMVYLRGEAFFDVEHDETHSFVVSTPQGYIKALGTQFNITAYDSVKTEVALKEGLISVGRTERGELKESLAKLTPHKLGVLTQEDGMIVSDIEDMSAFTGWTEGKLVFDSTSFSKVVQQLERWYDVEIDIADPKLAQRTLSATYDNMPLHEVIKVLSASLQMSYEWEGKTITFKDDSKVEQGNL